MIWIYLHGFNSAGFGAKVDGLRAVFGADAVLNPNLPPRPMAAMNLLRKLLHYLPAQEVFLLGSSLGGFYALNLALEFPLRAVLINPALRDVAAGLAAYLGTQTNYKTGENYLWTSQDLEDLRQLEVDPEHVKAASSRILAYLDAADEILPSPAHFALLQFWQIPVHMYPGGDHLFQHLSEALADVSQRLAEGRF